MWVSRPSGIILTDTDSEKERETTYCANVTESQGLFNLQDILVRVT